MQNNQKIPEGWSFKKLKDVAQVITGSTPSTADNTNYGNEFLFVSPADIKNDIKCVTNTITRLSYKGFNKFHVINQKAKNQLSGKNVRKFNKTAKKRLFSLP